MTERKKPQQEREKSDRAIELDERQLEQAAGGRRNDTSDPEEGGEATPRKY